MPEEAELLQDVLATPDDDAPRMAYADWCDLQSDSALKARAEFIRLQLALAQEGDFWEQYERKERTKELSNTFAAMWAAPLAPLVYNYRFDRGFVELLTLSARAFLDHAATLFALAPIRHLNITSLADTGLNGADFFQSAFLQPIRSLQMDGIGLRDEHLRQLAESPFLPDLRWLSVIENHLTLGGIEALAASPNFPRLGYADFFGNPDDPGEQQSHDNGYVVERWLPEEGMTLEARHGFLPWLHRSGPKINDRPDRFRMDANPLLLLPTP